MNLSDLKHSPNLYAFNDKFDLLLNLHKSKKFPKTLMLSGKKGIGKFTLVKHFLTYVFDKKYNYKLKMQILLLIHYPNLFQKIIFSKRKIISGI